MRRASVALIVMFSIDPTTAAAQTVEQARELYAEASYAEALTVLNGLESAAADPASMRDVLQYRALCLLALGRQREAEETVDRLVATEPAYSPDEVEVPPQIRTMFAAARQRRLPLLVRQQYTSAKEALERKDNAAAADGFRSVLTLLELPEAAAGLGEQAAADLRMLAKSFLELASVQPVRAQAEQSPAPASIPAQQPAAALQQPAAVAELPSGPVIFDKDQPDVVPPATIRQDVPSFNRAYLTPAPPRGLLEVVVSETGTVEAAVLRRPIHPAYDQLLLSYARNWRYTPATRSGTPVRFRKMIEVSVANQ